MTNAVYLFPHSPKEFPTPQLLGAFLQGELGRRGGVYRVATARGYRRVQVGSLVLFHKNRFLVGQAEVKQSLTPYQGTIPSPVTDRPYQGQLAFDSSTVTVYARLIPFEEVKRLAGIKINARAVQKISWQDYRRFESLIRNQP